MFLILSMVTTPNYDYHVYSFTHGKCEFTVEEIACLALAAGTCMSSTKATTSIYSEYVVSCKLILHVTLSGGRLHAFCFD